MFLSFSVAAPVVIGEGLPVSSLSGGDGADHLLCVGADQLDRVDGQVLVEVGSALGCIRTQVTRILPLLWRDRRTDRHKVRERERQREGERERKRGRQRERERERDKQIERERKTERERETETQR